MEGTGAHSHFLRQALAEAEVALAMGEVPVGAVVVLSGEVIARAHNLRETLHDPTAHAEMLALRQAATQLQDWRLPDATLYVTLEPCLMCAAAIADSRLKRVVFSAYDPEKGALGSRHHVLGQGPDSRRTEVLGGLMEEEASALLKRFFLSRRDV
ncbi:MAG: tRNA adenosine(34) deaminase TadA [Sulfobacillus sp.]